MLNIGISLSHGYDDIQPKLIKYVVTLIAMPLRSIINCSLLAGIVASKFKIAKVVPIFKNCKRDDPCKYRPVFILHQFLKKFEKVYCKPIIHFSET